MIHRYLQSYNNYFWQWEENAEIIAIPNDNTIAYTKYISEIIEALAPQGLPPFGALLLAIIATNSNGKNSINSVHSILQNTLKTTDDRCLTNAIEFLKMLSDLPAAYKTEHKKLLVFQALFNDCHYKQSVKNSLSISKNCKSYSFSNYKVAEFSKSEFEKEFRTIELLKNKFNNVQDIINKIASLPNFNDEKINVEEHTEINDPKDFTEQLIAHPKTFHIGSLIKRIWSGLNIPVHSTLPSQQPIGGISDLTNKGDFDRLLISEFANDDIVFLSRLANNEALFIRREIPPSNNDLERIILIDISLKNWGTPKSIAFATLLAIAKHPKTTISCSAYVVGDKYTPIFFEDINTIIDSLQLIDGSLNLTAGLTSFFKDFTNLKNKEIFIITESSTVKQGAMAKAMADYHAYINYWIYTNSEGDIDVYKKQQSSKKHLQHIKLPLIELWKKESTFFKNKRTENNTEHKYPILFRNSKSTKKIILTNEGEIFQVTNEKALLRFPNKDSKANEKGWELVCENLPFAHGEYEIGLLQDGTYMLLMFNPHNREITLLNLDTKETKTINFNHYTKTSNLSFVFNNQKFYHFVGTCCIDINGRLEKDDTIDKSIFPQKTKEVQEATKNHSQFISLFKNVKEVYINLDNKLMFNKHELQINKGGHIKIDQIDYITKKIEAKKISDTEFEFINGSTVEINKLGVFILKSSNPDVLPVYIPSLLNASLGIATQEYFAGNEYYFLEPKYEILLEDAGPKKIDIVKLVKDLTNKTLHSAKMIIDDAPSKVISNVSKIKAEQIKHTLENSGAQVSIKPLNSETTKELEKISTHIFFEKYINSFINQIIFHGNHY